MKNLPNRLNSILIKGLNYEKSGELDAAKKCFMDVYLKYPDYPDLINNIAKLCMQLNQNEEAHIMLLRSLNKNPFDYKILVTCAYVQLKLGIISEAEKNIRAAIDINPNQIDGYLSLSAILVTKEDFDLAIKAATAALNIDPFSTKALNNLGAIFNKIGDSKSAKSCFETSLIINSTSNSLATYNLASILYEDEDIDTSIKLFENIINSESLIESNYTIPAKFSLSYAYLRKGELEKGWDCYKLGFDYANPIQNRRAPNRSFIQPAWNFNDLSGKTLLVWGEQGLGDELLFFSVLHELIALNGRIIVECDSRLVKLLSRSYPNFTFRPSAYKNDFNLSAVNVDFDLHISAGDLMGNYRKNIESFQKGGPYIKINEELKIKYKNRLSKISPKKKIGICWRSSKMNALRNKHYINLNEWTPIFELSDKFDFINLQYDDCNEELLNIKSLYGIEIHNWKDIDLKNDLDSVLSLISSLDAVVSVGTSVASLTAAIGSELFMLYRKTWTNFGTSYYPAYPHVEIIAPEKNQPMSSILPLVADKLVKKFF